ncbi:hypothetical protein AB0K51_19805 [Kitasatospora sp. NPDC049285]|uniref:WXG100-like domain-containing protein n=1 Tax=Kitasatospora sp. NPDC049285 TaxID=3157096 RepID=UPI00343CA89D
MLGLLGVRFPGANEDELNHLADQLEKLAAALDSAQMTADKALTTLHQVYQGDSADKLSELWSTITKYSSVIVEACQTVAKVLRAAALVVEIAKTQSITQLFSIQAQLAAASSTGPWSAAAVLRIGREIMNRLLEEAVSRLGQTLMRPIDNLIDTAAQKIAPTPANNSTGHGFNIDLAQLATCAADIRRNADDIESHGNAFRNTVHGLKLGDSGDPFGKLVIAACEKILETIGQEVLNRILASFRDTAGKMDKMLKNLNENEDSTQLSLNSLGSTMANPFSPNALTAPGGAHGGTGGGSHDAGLASFAALMPKLGPVGGQLTGSHGGQGTDTLGLKDPKLSGAGGSGGGHTGGSGGGGVSAPGGGEHVNTALGPRLSMPTALGSSRGGGSTGRPHTDLETEAHTSGSPSGSGGSGSGGPGGRQAQAGGMVGPMPMGGAMGGMHGGGGGGGGHAGSGAVRNAAAAQRNNRGPGQHHGEDEDDFDDEGQSMDPLYAALQLGRVLPVRRNDDEDDDRRDRR